MDKTKNLANDEVFIARLSEIVSSNLQNDQFGVEKLAREAGYSRFTIYRRLLRIKGQSISGFIREIRLKKALELLTKTDNTASEISYKVGFGSPSYFNKCFHRYYGIPPGEVKKRNYKQETRGPVRKSRLKLRPIHYVLILLPLIVIAVTLWYFLYGSGDGHASDTETRPSIAVLPIMDLSDQGDNQYIWDGVMDEILDHLQHIKALDVRSRTSVEQYRNTTKDIATIGRDINADFILEGSARRYGGRFRIIVRLVEAGTDRQVWSKPYDGVYSDTIFLVQEDIARQITGSLGTALFDLQEDYSPIKTTTISAWEYVAKARYEWKIFRDSENEEHLNRADSLLSKAIKIDPEYIDAYVENVNIHRWLNNYDSMLVYADRILELDSNNAHGNVAKGSYYSVIERANPALAELAIAYLNKGLDLMPGNEFAHQDLGWMYLFRTNEPIKALQHFRKWLSVNGGNNPEADLSIGYAYSLIGDFDRASTHFEKAFRSGPACIVLNYYNVILLMQGAIEKELHFTDSMCAIHSCENICHRWGVISNVYSRNFEEARLHLDYWEYDVNRPIPSTLIGYTYWKTGRVDEAQEIFRKVLSENFKSSLYPDRARAEVYAILGQRKEALIHLRKWANEGLISPSFKYNPLLDNIRHDPEFAEIVHIVETKLAGIRKKIRDMEAKGEFDI